MKVAIVYDRVNKWGGAERLILALQKIFPNAHLYASILNSKSASWAKEFKIIKTSFLQNLPLFSRHQLYAILMPLAFESFDFDGYDLVISITSESAKGIITKPETLHVCICLTPTRYLWSGYEEYFRNPLLKFISKPAVSYLRNWDKIASQRPDSYIAISQEVRKRIKKYYGRDSKVIYPPVTLGTRNQSLEVSTRLQAPVTKRYFLVVSRLVPYKRIDLVIRACNKLKLPLKIAGTGSQEWFLKLISGPTVQFLGRVSDEKLIDLYRNCNALIFPGIEDFGLSMAEAQSFGAPVIAYRAGGALEIIKEGETGEFFDKQDVDSLKNLLEKWDNKRYNYNSCIENAEKFSFAKFKQKLFKIIQTNQ